MAMSAGELDDKCCTVKIVYNPLKQKSKIFLLAGYARRGNWSSEIEEKKCQSPRSKNGLPDWIKKTSFENEMQPRYLIPSSDLGAPKHYQKETGWRRRSALHGSRVHKLLELLPKYSSFLKIGPSIL